MSWGTNLFAKFRNFLPSSGFTFNRPIVIFQSDDWGRVGLRDAEGFDLLQQAGLSVGQRAYDWYSLETADDVEALAATLRKHRDSSGRPPTLEMNFIVGNLDFGKMEGEDWRKIHILSLADGLPAGWNRPALYDSYRSGVADGVFHPALHGTTHFCVREVDSNLTAGGERAELLRTLWKAGTPYIHWRMPWIGYEYWGPENPPMERFLPEQVQEQLVGQSVGAFAKMFGVLPGSACAPGYRANEDTNAAWALHGIKVAQNGPGLLIYPYLDRNELLQTVRTVEFEPATNENFSLEDCIRSAEDCFSKGLPAIISLHSINFHSSVRDFRTPTLKYLDELLTALESRHNDLLYLHDADLYDLVQRGVFQSSHGAVRVDVLKKTFRKSSLSGKKVPQ